MEVTGQDRLAIEGFAIIHIEIFGFSIESCD
jgi:hypothetical protein